MSNDHTERWPLVASVALVFKRHSNNHFISDTYEFNPPTPATKATEGALVALVALVAGCAGKIGLILTLRKSSATIRGRGV